MAADTCRSDYYRVESLRSDLSWGAIVIGLNPAHLADTKVRAALYNLWIQQGVIVFKELDGIETQLNLSRIFGPLRTHPTREAVTQSTPELMDVNFEPQTGWLAEVDGEVRGSWLPWH